MAKKRMKKKKYFRFIKTVFFLVALALVVGAIGARTSFFNKANFEEIGRGANLQVNFGSSHPFFRNWRYLAQGGESPKDSLIKVAEEVRKLDIAYVRIDHIYDFYETVKKGPNGLEFDWTRLDRELTAITEMGAKPFISLSYMPPAISGGTEVDLPVNWADWQVVVQKTIEHVSGKGNLGMRDVYYEVWNEPDLFGKFTIGGDKNYLDLYKYASLGAQAASDTHSFKFGGPAMTNLMRKWFDGLLSFVANNNLRLDFVSWHRYSKNIEDFESDVQNAESWIVLHPRLAKAELIISEAGINSELDSAYDNDVAAAHTLSVATSLTKHRVKIFNFEIKDGLGPSMYWGRWGILTNENFGSPTPKPRYHAFLFLSEMSGEIAQVSGWGSSVKAFGVSDDKRKTYKVLLVNYDKFNLHRENVPVSVQGLPSGNLTLKKINFMGNEIVETVNTPDGNWSGIVTLSPNSAAILEFTAN